MVHNLTTHQWRRKYGKPLLYGAIKSEPDDFIVEENLGFEPTGEGEHTALFIQKTNLNTAFLAEQLARFANVPLKSIGFSGRKDKFAVTRQWYSVHGHKLNEADWQGFENKNVSVLRVAKHNKKIKVGSHRSNFFQIVVRDIVCKDENALVARLEKIKQHGFLNYFGQQRFGDLYKNGEHILNGNLLLAERLLAGETIKNRNKKNIVISALRSWLFNEFVSKRVSKGIIDTLCDGDVVLLRGSNSFFVSEPEDRQKNEERLSSRDIVISAPLWGKGDLHSTMNAYEFEKEFALQYPEICETLEKLSLVQQRRPVLEYPLNFSHKISNDTLTLQFELSKGTFATSLLREFMYTANELNNENTVE